MKIKKLKRKWKIMILKLQLRCVIIKRKYMRGKHD